MKTKQERLEALRQKIKANSHIKYKFWREQLWITQWHFSNFMSGKDGLKITNIEKLERLLDFNLR